VAIDYIPPNSTPVDVDDNGDYVLSVPGTGPISLVPSRSDWVLIQRVGGGLGEVAVWRPGEPFVLVAASAGYDRNPLLGNPGAYNPDPSKEYVVYRDKGEDEWYLKAWSISKGVVVSEIAVGDGDGPKLNDFHGYVFFEDEVGTHWRWDPMEVSSGNPDEGSGNPQPFPPEVIPFDPTYHGCSHLSDLRVGDRFALIRGEDCGPSKESQLFAITMWHNLFVSYDGRYQPFFVTPVLSGQAFYAISHDGAKMVVVDENGMGWRIEIDKTKVLPMHALKTPRDNDSTGVPLAPWNLGAYGYGEIDYAGTGQWDKWILHLSDKQTYRISVIGDDDCSRWYTDTAFSLYGMSLIARVDDEYECAVYEFTPSYLGDYELYVYRRDWGLPGIAPPLYYTLVIEVL